MSTIYHFPTGGMSQENSPEALHAEALKPARGILNGVALGLAAWLCLIGVFVVAYLWSAA